MTLLQLAASAAHSTIYEGFDAVRLASDDLEATFVPELGMVGASLRHRGEELLGSGDGLRAYRDRGAVMGLPLLHPWANRLSGDEYALHGRRVRLPPGPPLVRRDANGLPIHGLLAAHPGWIVDSIDAGRHGASLQATIDVSSHPALFAAFPFAHTLTIRATVTGRALQVATTLTPTGGVPVPIAFGFHPYLRLPGIDRSGWRLDLPRRRRLGVDGVGIPDGRTRLLPARRMWLESHGFDDGFDLIEDGAAFTISGGGRTVGVRHECGYPVAQVYSPPGAQFVCFEPMSAPVDALRSGAGLRRATPGRPFTAVFSIDVQEVRR